MWPTYSTLRKERKKVVYSINEIKERITPVAQKYRLPAVYLFGSYARGDATEESDVDILVDRTGTKLIGLFEMGGLFNDLEEAIGKPIDLITTSSLEQEDTKRRTPWMIENVNKDKVIIYAHA